jgi:hypothetical protein
MRGAGGAVEEAPLREPLLLAVDDRDALPAEHEEVLLEALRVVEAARLPRLERADADHEPARHLPDPTPR